MMGWTEQDEYEAGLERKGRIAGLKEAAEIARSFQAGTPEAFHRSQAVALEIDARISILEKGTE
jgi:hypothetical protein